MLMIVHAFDQHTTFYLMHPKACLLSLPPQALVLSCSLLAGLELLHVPAADGQVALVLVHAVGEALDVRGAGAACLGGGGLRVQAIVHGLPGLRVGIGRQLFDGGSRGSAAEETTDGMAD